MHRFSIMFIIFVLITIGTINSTYGNLDVNGTISTGDEGIKWKLFSGTTGSSSITFTHGLDVTKIYSVSCSIRDEGGSAYVYDNRHAEHPDWSYRLRFTDTLIYIENIGTALDDANDVYKCVVWYVE